jgi:hypothetical protein
MKRLIFILLLPAVLLGGCVGHLDPAGLYHGDQNLYVAHQTITTSYTVLDAFLKFELANRNTLKATPEVTRLADDIRLHAKGWWTSAEALTDAYAANPTPDNAVSLNKAIAVIQTALDQATKYLVTQPTS